MEVKKIWEDIQFWSNIFFSKSWQVKEKAINLFSSIWKTLIKEERKEFIIDYPGEYEKYNIYIQTIVWDTDRLNFFVFDNENNVSFAFIQDPSILEKLDLARYPEKWFYTDDIVANQLDKLGFEWELEKIN